MKLSFNHYLTLFIFSIILTSCQDTGTSYKTEVKPVLLKKPITPIAEIVPGVTLQQCHLYDSSAFPARIILDKEFYKSENIAGMKGNWNYMIGNDTLKSMYYRCQFDNNYIPDTTEAGVLKMNKELSNYFHINFYRERSPDNNTIYYLVGQMKNMWVQVKINGVYDGPQPQVGELIKGPIMAYYMEINFITNKNAEKKSLPEWKYYIGMPLTEFAKKTPEFFPLGILDEGQICKEDTMLGNNGLSCYDFEHDTLICNSWSSSSADDSKKEFKKFHSLSKKIIEYFNSKYKINCQYEINKPVYDSRNINGDGSMIVARWSLKNYTTEFRFRFNYDGKDGDSNYSVELIYTWVDYLRFAPKDGP